MLGQVVAGSGWLRFGALGGAAALVVATAAMLLIDAGTPGWLTALVLCGRGLAFGLATQPLLVTMMQRLRGPDVADGSTLFNVVQRVAGSFGIGLLATLFAQRVHDRVAAAAVRTPAGLRDAAVAGFHDVVWALVAVSALGVLVALLVRDDRARPAPHGEGS
jgi:hypothetical protein